MQKIAVYDILITIRGVYTASSTKY